MATVPAVVLRRPLSGRGVTVAAEPSLCNPGVPAWSLGSPGGVALSDLAREPQPEVPSRSLCPEPYPRGSRARLAVALGHSLGRGQSPGGS